MLLNELQYLDNGFYILSGKKASKLCGGKLPKHGYEKLIEHEGAHYWIARTRHNGKWVWSIRDSHGWELVKDIPTLA